MFKVMYEGDEKIVIKVPPTVVDDETIEILMIYPHSMEFITKKEYIRRNGKRIELASKKRVKGQTFRDFLVMNGALERIFGLNREGCGCE